jgi:hypothetical protein
MTSFAATRAGRAAYTVAALAATYYCAWLATAVSVWRRPR